MFYKKAGFVGGGRITRVVLNGWKRKNALPAEVVVVEIKEETADRLKKEFPGIKTATRSEELAGAEIIFLCVHPPVLAEILPRLKSIIQPETVICSFVPKFDAAKLAEALGEHTRIIRMNPNATSYVNAGYNPVSFGPGIAAAQKEKFLNQMTLLGPAPEVKDELIEVYATISAMGPSYLWFLFYELVSLGVSFGLTEKEALEAVSTMIAGAANVMAESGLNPEQVMDLIPARPFAEEEEKVKEIFRQKITGIYSRLKN
jgi:pyrroline-5-carboxylate reductase